jgi:RNA polymerase sigma-70 factor (ECF subfamily)
MTKAELDGLVLAFQAGDQRALALLYQCYQRKLRLFAASLSGDPGIADDLVQNVWLKLSQRIHRLDDPRVFVSWLYKAVRWEVLDWQKSAGQRLQQAQCAEEAAAWIAAEPPVEYSDLHLAIRALESASQELLQLHYFHQLELTEIALVLGVPLGTVKSRLHRARQQLKTQLGDEMISADD